MENSILLALLKSLKIDIEKSDASHRVSSIRLETRLSVNTTGESSKFV
jgi:hypothetical protein